MKQLRKAWNWFLRVMRIRVTHVVNVKNARMGKIELGDGTMTFTTIGEPWKSLARFFVAVARFFRKVWWKSLRIIGMSRDATFRRDCTITTRLSFKNWRRYPLWTRGSMPFNFESEMPEFYINGLHYHSQMIECPKDKVPFEIHFDKERNKKAYHCPGECNVSIVFLGEPKGVHISAYGSRK